MWQEFGAAIGVGAMLAMNGAALAQDPCATIASQAASINGFAGAKAEAIKSGDITICDVWSKDRKSHITLIVEPPQAASGVAMRKMLAANTAKKETGMTVKEEPSLGASAFSFVKKEQLSFSGVGKGGVYTLNLHRDACFVRASRRNFEASARQFTDLRACPSDDLCGRDRRMTTTSHQTVLAAPVWRATDLVLRNGRRTRLA